MAKPLKIYLADLTHSYIALANRNFPLGIGYIASALKKVFENELSLEIFKYTTDLNNALKRELPDAFLFSNFMWNQNLGLAFAKIIKRAKPETLIVGGGPNFSKFEREQIKILKKNEFLDFIILYEGENAIIKLINNYLNVGRNINKLKNSNNSSTLTLLDAGTLNKGEIILRLKNSNTTNSIDPEEQLITINDVPSPYLSGLLDKFFDNKLYPLIETSRGCPFSCLYCQQGSKYYSLVTYRNKDILNEELEYIAFNMNKYSSSVERFEIASPNFGMHSRDIEFCSFIRKIQEKYNWPLYIGCTTGKNNQENIIKAVKKLLPDSLVISNSMQSTHPPTLEAIRRKNISLKKYTHIQELIENNNLRSMADMILGLPLESKKTHFKGLYDILDAGIQEFTPYQAMMLPNTPLEDEELIKKYGYKTKFRILPRAVGVYNILKDKEFIIDFEETVFSTNTLSYEDYLDSRRLHLLIMVYHNSNVFNLVKHFIESKGLKISSLFKILYDYSFKDEFPLKKPFDLFIEETNNELFETKAQCIDFFKANNNLEKLKNGEIGGNLLWKFISIIYINFLNEAVKTLLDSLNKIVPLTRDEYSDLERLLLARVVKVSEPKPARTINVQIRSPIVLRILESKYDLKMTKGSNEINIKMEQLSENYKTMMHAKDIYPDNKTGWSLILATHRIPAITRELVLD